MFGKGKIPNFEQLLDTKLSPFLSSPAYQFWRAKAYAFRTSFHHCGYSGHALRIAAWAFKIGGVSAWVDKFIDASTIEQQAKIWDEYLRPAFLTPWITKLIFGNP
jgi:betaine lipid synthase